MFEYITREEAIVAICEDCLLKGSRLCEVCRCKSQLYSVPAADVRPAVKAIWKHVQWVVDEEWQEGGYWISRCSNCSMPYHTETPFCPRCGAEMEES